MTNFKVKNVHCLGCNDNPNCRGSTIDFNEPIKEAEKRGEEKALVELYKELELNDEEEFIETAMIRDYIKETMDELKQSQDKEDK